MVFPLMFSKYIIGLQKELRLLQHLFFQIPALELYVLAWLTREIGDKCPPQAPHSPLIISSLQTKEQFLFFRVQSSAGQIYLLHKQH